MKNNKNETIVVCFEPGSGWVIRQIGTAPRFGEYDPKVGQDFKTKPEAVKFAKRLAKNLDIKDLQIYKK